MQVIKRFIKRNFSNWMYGRRQSPARKIEIGQWVQELKDKPPTSLSAASYDVFTYHGEDGILLYLLDQLGDVPKTFVDIGAGDCIKSNCASLAVHFNWNGIFIDMNKNQLVIGKNFYKNKIASGASIRFAATEVTAENINQLLKEQGADSSTGLLSIDIDGNDYWVWKVIEVIQPEIVLIEAKVEFGHRSIAVSYGKHNHHSVDNRYNGASVEALRKLGVSKGYKLVGANKQGYNLFFVKQGCNIPEETTEKILSDPDTVNSFYPDSFFAAHTFENI